MTKSNAQPHKKRFKGIVVSDKMEKTVVVLVSRYVKHPKYGKYMKIDKRFKAHVEGAKPALGASVVIEETRPISRDKRFRVIQGAERL